MSTAIISLKDVEKNFGLKKVLRGLSFDVAPGELIALLGCNGAGKTTTINMLLGLEQADAGEISIFGSKPGSMQVRSLLGVTPQGTDFPEGLKVKEVLELVAAHYPNAIALDEAVTKFSLTDIADQVTAGLSYGQKRRVAVALAFIGNPKLIFLDEPTTGLDVQSRHALWDIIRNYVKSGGTLVLTTHYLEEAEKLASRVLVLDKGVISQQGTVAEIIAETGMMSVVFEAPACPPSLDNAVSIKQSAGCYTIETSNSDALLRELVNKNIDFANLIVHKSNLETAFLEINAASAADGGV